MNPPSESGLNHLNQILILVGAIHHAGISPLPMEARYPAVKALSATGRRAGQDSDHPWFLWWGGCTQMQMALNFCCPVVLHFRIWILTISDPYPFQRSSSDIQRFEYGRPLGSCKSSAYFGWDTRWVRFVPRVRATGTKLVLLSTTEGTWMPSV